MGDPGMTSKEISIKMSEVPGLKCSTAHCLEKLCPQSQENGFSLVSMCMSITQQDRKKAAHEYVHVYADARGA